MSLDNWKEYWKSKDADDVTWAQVDAEGELLRQFRVLSLGTTIIIDREGKISYRDEGATPYDVLRAKVKQIS